MLPRPLMVYIISCVANLCLNCRFFTHICDQLSIFPCPWQTLNSPLSGCEPEVSIFFSSADRSCCFITGAGSGRAARAGAAGGHREAPIAPRGLSSQICPRGGDNSDVTVTRSLPPLNFKFAAATNQLARSTGPTPLLNASRTVANGTPRSTPLRTAAGQRAENSSPMAALAPLFRSALSWWRAARAPHRASALSPRCVSGPMRNEERRGWARGGGQSERAVRARERLEKMMAAVGA